MLYDRVYMRQPQESTTKQWSGVYLLMWTTIGIFILQQVLNVMFPNPYMRDNENLFMNEWFSLSGGNFQQLKVWTLFSYSFLHSTQGFLHILSNMLGLFFIGRMLEPILGRHKFLILYFGGAFLGGLVYLALHFNTNIPVVGASAAIFALLALFCLLRPEQPVTLLLFFILPITLKPRYLFWGSLVISLLGILFYELPGKSNIAHSAHLGGLIAGILFYRYIHHRGSGFHSGNGSATVEQPAWFKGHKKTDHRYTYQVNRSNKHDANRGDLPGEVDRILDKINTSGFGSLSDREKNALERAKDLLSK